LEWKGSHGEVACIVLQEIKGRDVLLLRFFYLDAQGELKPCASGVTIPLDQIEPLRKALRQVNEKSGSGSKSLRSKEQAAPKPAKKIKSLEKRSGSKE